MDRLLVGRESLALTMTMARSMWVGALVEEAAARLGIPADTVEGTEFDPGGDLGTPVPRGGRDASPRRGRSLSW